MYFYYKVYKPVHDDLLLPSLTEEPSFLGTHDNGEYIVFFFKDKPTLNVDTYFKKSGYTFEKGYLKENIEDWLAKFREGFEPFNPTPNLTILPAWYSGKDLHCESCIYIYPGQAFGTGQHFTTRSALQLIEQINIKNKSVLDFGCGTGILSIYAEQCGADEILALDIDPVAVKEAARHLHLNRSKRIKLLCGDIFVVKRKFDIILGNIVFDVLNNRLAALRDRLTNGGAFIFSGIIKPKKQEFINNLKAHGFSIHRLLEDEEWVSGLSILD